MSREMKHSGIEWIGDIPEHWRVNKVFRLFERIGSGTTPSSFEDDAFQGSINWIQSGDLNGGILRESKNKISQETLARYSALSVYKAPFIIVAMYGASVGNISISEIDGCVNQACCVLCEPLVDNTFAFYSIMAAQRYLMYRAVGGGQPNISQNTLKQLWIVEPPLSEQQRIADYLDKVCSEIDGLVALQEAMIDELKAYKQSVITEAVTRGLNPNVPLKPSGIDWIELIPKDWDVIKGKNLLIQMSRPVRETDEVVTCFRDGEVVLRSERRTEGFTMSDKEIGYQGINKGDIVIHGMDGFAGAMGVSKSTGKGSPVLVVCNLKESDNSRYIIYYLRSLAMTNVFLALATGIRERSCDLRWKKIAELPFIRPSFSEQQQIANYLDTKCSEIDSLIAIKQQKIEELKEYKKSVIYEYVTGKKEVV